jgi:hypothetical protein
MRGASIGINNTIYEGQDKKKTGKTVLYTITLKKG